MPGLVLVVEGSVKVPVACLHSGSMFSSVSIGSYSFHGEEGEEAYAPSQQQGQYTKLKARWRFLGLRETEY